jgi:hypothetical protein
MSKNHRSSAFWHLFIVFLTLTGFLAFPQVTQAKPRLDTIITADIIVDTIWNLAGSPYIIDTGMNILNGATLTIEAGVQVKFNAGKWLDAHGRHKGRSPNRLLYLSANGHQVVTLAT